jgi:hypothetical protein
MIGQQSPASFVGLLLSNDDGEFREIMIMLYPLILTPEQFLAILLDSFGFQNNMEDQTQKM